MFVNNPTPAVLELGSRVSLHVLVADDDDISRQELAAAVVALGHRCTTAHDGAQALELHRAQDFDVILSDWVMPYMDGLELCRRVRAEAGGRYLHFIMLTSLGDRAHVVEALRDGVDDYLTKPADLEQLQAKLRASCRIAAHHHGLSRSNVALQKVSERAFRAARTDPLTGAGNRLQLHDDLAQLRAVSRYGHRSCAALCDVDNFKRYNDEFGHVSGDEALRKVAESMRSSLRTGDSLYRYGGDEFLVILPGQSPSEAAAAMDRVRRDIAGLAIPHAAETLPRVVTISVGLAELTHHSDQTQVDSLRRADAAMYLAKGGGRNQVVLSPLGAEDAPEPDSPANLEALL